MNKQELAEWVADNPHLDPRTPEVQVTLKDKHHHTQVTLVNTQTSDRASLQFDCTMLNGCQGCDGYLCRGGGK
jgi:hypothetical protein